MMGEREKSDFEPFDRWLLFLMLASPTVWLTHLSVSYALVPQSCAWSDKTLLHLLTLLALITTATCGWLSWRALPLPRESRRRFMAIMGVVFGALFAMLVVANEIPNLILRSCD